MNKEKYINHKANIEFILNKISKISLKKRLQSMRGMQAIFIILIIISYFSYGILIHGDMNYNDIVILTLSVLLLFPIWMMFYYLAKGSSVYKKRNINIINMISEMYKRRQKRLSYEYVISLLPHYNYTLEWVEGLYIEDEYAPACLCIRPKGSEKLVQLNMHYDKIYLIEANEETLYALRKLGWDKNGVMKSLILNFTKQIEAQLKPAELVLININKAKDKL